ncbi:MAG: hypothetical protein J7623_06320 [Chitinophaga sp.]|uniref:hypothetical protein n=1 Tax=Chitinophaga sp. TaxID=1869181 RepID=UPI001B114855|nr:hypothetical protein [Chitinophaga sp.]MBO9728237.1 hypothetical protein [Chitinophaga sp.]
MKFLKRLFSKKEHLIECPRCLGKGCVDDNDIKRLGQELRWKTGRCAYCTGTGKVASDMINKVAVDEAYLTTNLTSIERKRFIHGHPDAIERSEIAEMQIQQAITEIRQLHFIKKLDAEQIAELYLISEVGFGDKRYNIEKAKMIAYINKVIAAEDKE